MELVTVCPDLTVMNRLNALRQHANRLGLADDTLRPGTKSIHDQIARGRIKEHDGPHSGEGGLHLVQGLKSCERSALESRAEQSHINWTLTHTSRDLGTARGARNNLKPKMRTRECVLQQLTTHRSLIRDKHANSHGTRGRRRFGDSR